MPGVSCVVVVLQPIPAAYVIVAPLVVAHSQFPLAPEVAMDPNVIDVIVVAGDVVTVYTLDAVDPGPGILN